MARAADAVSQLTIELAAYMAAAGGRPLPEVVAEKTRLHILDTLAAVLSGSRLRAGLLARAYVESLGGKPDATVIGAAERTNCVNAALANGMAGHADETDDSHLAGRFHPGCGIVPAAFAVAEREAASGAALTRAVALGYDIGARATRSLGYARPDTSRHSTHSLGAAFGAAAAAASLLRLDVRQMRHVLSYTVQQASGVPYWQRDSEHVEKAFDFGGMGARNGVAAATMVASGFSAVDDPLSGAHQFFSAFGEAPAPGLLVDGLGQRYEIMAASIKKWCVGSPIQSMLDALEALMATHGFNAGDIVKVVVEMPDDRLHIVDNRAMPDVCAQHLAAAMLIDRGLDFASTHDHARMDDPAVRALRAKIELVPSPVLTHAKPARQSIVSIETRDGRSLRHHAVAVRGTPENPMTRAEVEAKARDLASPVVGAARADGLVAAVAGLETLADARDLRAFLTA